MIPNPEDLAPYELDQGIICRLTGQYDLKVLPLSPDKVKSSVIGNPSARFGRLGSSANPRSAASTTRSGSSPLLHCPMKASPTLIPTPWELQRRQWLHASWIRSIRSSIVPALSSGNMSFVQGLRIGELPAWKAMATSRIH